MEEQKLGGRVKFPFYISCTSFGAACKKSKLEIGRVVSACSRHDKQSKSVKGVDKK